MRRLFLSLAGSALVAGCTTYQPVAVQPPEARDQVVIPTVDLTRDTALNPSRIPANEPVDALPLPNPALARPEPVPAPPAAAASAPVAKPKQPVKPPKSDKKSGTRSQPAKGTAATKPKCAC